MRAIGCATVILLVSCTVDSTAPIERPSAPVAAISDAVHSAGTAGFYFLPPMVAAPAVTGAPDGDIATLAPQVVICDLIHGEDADCGGTTTAAASFASSSSPPITVDVETGQYHVNWDTKGSAFAGGHTYRVHVRAGAPGARRELGYADVLLTENPGQAKNVATGDVIVLNDGQTLPIKFRIERGVIGAVSAEVTPGSVETGGSAYASATVLDLHGAPLSGVNVGWNSTGASVTLADATVATNPAGVASNGVVAGLTVGTATISAAAGGISASATLTIIDPTACIPSGSATVIATPVPSSTGPLYATSQDGNSVVAFAAGANGNTAPVLTISGPATNLALPRGIARDAAGFLYVANQATSSVAVFAPGASGNATPVRYLYGANTQLNVPEGIAVDGAGSIYVANQADNKILVFSASANGNVAPARRITGSCSGVNRPMGLALDVSGHLYVANLGSYNNPGSQSVTVYDAGANGNAMPRATITGGSTGLFNPLGISVDAAGTIYVANYGNTDQGPSNAGTSVTIYAAGSSGNAAPTRMIIGTMAEPTGMAIDATGMLYVANFFFDFLTVYAAGATGLAIPVASISGPSTLLLRPAYLTF